MLRRSPPTISPTRFKTNEIKSLLETIQNVSNRSVLNEFGIIGGPQPQFGSGGQSSRTHDSLMRWKPQQRSLDDNPLDVPMFPSGQEPKTGGGSALGSQTTTSKISGPQATSLGRKAATGFEKLNTTKARGFSPGVSDKDEVMKQMGSRAGKFADVGGKPNPGMDNEAGAYYMITEPALVAAAAGGAESLAKAAETVGNAAGPLSKIVGAATLAAGAKTAGEFLSALPQGTIGEDPNKYLTKRTPQAPPKLK